MNRRPLALTHRMLQHVQVLLFHEAYAYPPSGAARARLVRIEGYLIQRLIRCPALPASHH